MKTLITLLLLCAGIVPAQTTINVSITLDNDTQKIVNAWRQTRCAATDADNKCIALKYPTLKSLLTEIVGTAVNAQIATSAQWAIDNNDPSLPGVVSRAVADAKASEAAIKARKEVKATVQ